MVNKMELFELVQEERNPNFPKDYFHQTFKNRHMPDYSVEIEWNELGDKKAWVTYKGEIIYQHDTLTNPVKRLIDSIAHHRASIVGT